ncbi:KH domain-containing protein [Candidatus Saccharibacteria bacterium]|jgi:predicted RNA-binding protein YlqC (UPF0109 family)|nr:KH domain-containing protein [Candidatus Saccharibacteria bacterium]
MSESTIDQQFIEYVVKSLVSKPDAVIVERIIDEKGVLLTLTVDPEDLGRVIGKRGATAQSLRTLLRALGTKNEARYNLKIVDNGIPREERESMRGDREDRPAREDRPKRDENQGGGGGWSTEPSTGSSDNYTTDTTPAETTKSAPVDNSSDDESSAAEDAANDSGEEESAIQRTRRELEALDDLDV